MTAVLSDPLRFIGRALTGRVTREDLSSAGVPELVVGAVFTWLAGIGRYWDNPRASPLQHAGVGSLIYVVALSAFLWLLLMPLKPTRWSYREILTFVCAVSPPALLYAIPVERFSSLAAARQTRLWFLAVVASWRVALYVTFLFRYAGFRNVRLTVAALLPLTVIVVTLTALNLERAVFDIMRGVDPSAGTSADSAYAVLLLFTILSFWVAPVVAVLYLVEIYRARTP